MNVEDEGRRGAIENCAAGIVAAYVSKNHVPRGDLPALITSVRATLTELASDGQAQPAEAEADEKVTASQARRSITPDALVSFIDGKPYKSLKRHLTANGLGPESYRAKYGLPVDYPMVAPSYSERRSALAHGINFGRWQRDRGAENA